MMKLHSKNLGIAVGVVVAVLLFISTVIGVLFNFGLTHINMIVAILPVYSISYIGAFVGLIYGFILGYILGFMLATIYNMLDT